MMSRQRAGWGLTRTIERMKESFRPKSLTAGKNKYEPHASNGEKIRRMRQIEKLADKAARKKIEVNRES